MSKTLADTSRAAPVETFSLSENELQMVRTAVVFVRSDQLFNV